MFNIISGKINVENSNLSKKNYYSLGSIKIYSEKKINIIINQYKLTKFIVFGTFFYKNEYFNSDKLNERKIYNILNRKNLPKIINSFDGKFAIIKISGKKKFEIFQDKNGIFDIYYTRSYGNTIISSDLKFVTSIQKKLKYDQAALINVLTVYGFRPPKKHTLYENIKRIGVGEYLEINNDKSKIKKLPFKEIKIINFNTKQHQEYSNILIESVEKRSSSKGNILYLSSGWDSTSILAVLVKLYGPKKVRPVIGRMNFSKKYGVCNPYELKKAKKICDYFGVKLEVTEFDYWRRGPELAEKHKDLMKTQMMSGMAFYQWIDLARYVSKNYNGESVLCGEISDGAHNFGFSQNASNNVHPDLDFRKYSDKMYNYIYGPSFLKNISNKNGDLVFEFLKRTLNESNFDDVSKNQNKLKSQFLCGLFSRQKRFPFWSLSNYKFLNTAGQEIYKKEIENYYFDEISKKMTAKNLYFWYIHLYNSFHWQGGTVASIDKVANEYNFNVEFPFRDHKILDFLSQMPENWGRGLELKPTKYPLKYFLENIIKYPYFLQEGPHSYLYDTNSNFDHGAEWIYRSAFRKRYTKLLKKREYRDILSKKFFNLNYYDKMVDQYINNTKEAKKLDWGSDLFNLIALVDQGWY